MILMFHIWPFCWTLIIYQKAKGQGHGDKWSTWGRTDTKQYNFGRFGTVKSTVWIPYYTIPYLQYITIPSTSIYFVNIFIWTCLKRLKSQLNRPRARNDPFIKIDNTLGGSIAFLLCDIVEWLTTWKNDINKFQSSIIMHSDWLTLVTWLATSNHDALF